MASRAGRGRASRARGRLPSAGRRRCSRLLRASWSVVATMSGERRGAPLSFGPIEFGRKSRTEVGPPRWNRSAKRLGCPPSGYSAPARRPSDTLCHPLSVSSARASNHREGGTNVAGVDRAGARVLAFRLGKVRVATEARVLLLQLEVRAGRGKERIVARVAGEGVRDGRLDRRASGVADTLD